jgi:hypothetical protein
VFLRGYTIRLAADVEFSRTRYKVHTFFHWNAANCTARVAEGPLFPSRRVVDCQKIMLSPSFHDVLFLLPFNHNGENHADCFWNIIGNRVYGTMFVFESAILEPCALSQASRKRNSAVWLLLLLLLFAPPFSTRPCISLVYVFGEAE